MGCHCGILTISFFLLLFSLAEFVFTYGSYFGFVEASSGLFEEVLKRSHYACLWAGIPALIASIVGMVCGCTRTVASLTTFVVFAVLVCILHAALIPVVYFSDACEKPFWAGDCFKDWSSDVIPVIMATTLILDAAVIIILTLIGAITAAVALYKIQKSKAEIELQKRRPYHSTSLEMSPPSSPTSTYLPYHDHVRRTPSSQYVNNGYV